MIFWEQFLFHPQQSPASNWPAIEEKWKVNHFEFCRNWCIAEQRIGRCAGGLLTTQAGGRQSVMTCAHTCSMFLSTALLCVLQPLSRVCCYELLATSASSISPPGHWSGHVSRCYPPCLTSTMYKSNMVQCTSICVSAIFYPQIWPFLLNIYLATRSWRSLVMFLGRLVWHGTYFNYLHSIREMS